MGDTQPPLDYLLVCSQDAVESYLLSRLNRLANLHRALSALINDWLQVCQDERLGRWIADLRRGSTRPVIPPPFASRAPSFAPVRTGQVLPSFPLPKPVLATLPVVAAPQHSSQLMLSCNATDPRFSPLGARPLHRVVDIGERLVPSRLPISAVPRTSASSAIGCAPFLGQLLVPRTAALSANRRPVCPERTSRPSPSGRLGQGSRSDAETRVPVVTAPHCTIEKSMPHLASDHRLQDSAVSRCPRLWPDKPGPVRISRPDRRLSRGQSFAS